MSAKAVDYFSLGHPLRGIASRISHHVRKRLFDLFMEVMAPTPDSLVLDVGVTPDRSLEESNFFERLYPYKNRLVAAGIEDASFLETLFPGIRFIQTSGEELPFGDKTFDIVFCSAVLEHVGDSARQRKFIKELLRVSRRFFITTPNRRYPVEFHTLLPFIHWLPRPVHQALLRGLGLTFWARTDNLNLLTPAGLLDLFPEGVEPALYKHRLLGLPSNLAVHGSS